MKGRRRFSRHEAARIRRLLVEKVVASRDKQKAIRNRIRGFGFYISDFRTSGRGFTAADFDRLIEEGRIEVAEGWFARLRQACSRVLHRLLAPRRRGARRTARAAGHPRGDGLPPLLSRGLRVVFIGTEPGSESLKQHQYYAHPENTFYQDLFEAGFTPRQLTPAEYRILFQYGIGLDDVYGDPAALRRRIQEAEPKAVCFNSKAALERFTGTKIEGSWRGSSASRHVRLSASVVWAVPDSSPRASSHHSSRLKLLRELRSRLD